MLLSLLAITARTAAPADAVQLSSRDRQQVTAAACEVVGASGAERLTATGMGRAGRIAVAVQCKPHRTEESLPVARLADCSNANGIWRCENAQDALLVTLRKSTLAVVPGAVSSRLAVELVTEAAELSLPPFHKPATMLLQTRCTIGQGRAANFKGGMQYELDCVPGTVFLTQDCWQQRCRYFITGSVERADGSRKK